MGTCNRLGIRMAFLIILTLVAVGFPSAVCCAQEKAEEVSEPAISVPQDVSKVMLDQAAQLKSQLREQARSVFKREPLGFDLGTLRRVRDWGLKIPFLLPQLVEQIVQRSRLLGVLGSVVLIIFLGVLSYSFVGRRKVLARLEHVANPLLERIPAPQYPYFFSALRVIAAALIPLLLFGLFRLVQALLAYDAPWFSLIGNLIKLWMFAALTISILHEVLLSNLFPISDPDARSIYRMARFVTLFVVVSLAVFWGAKAFHPAPDVLALVRFAVSVSIVFASLFLLLKKQAMTGVLPELPYKVYRIFCDLFKRFYYPLVCVTFVSGLLWCFGYRNFTSFFWVKTWAVAGAFLGIMIVYHNLQRYLSGWIQKREPSDEIAQALHKSLRVLLIFVTVTTASTVILKLLGLFDPLKAVISFPMFVVGATPVSLWTLGKAAIIITVFLFVSRIMRSYLDYMIYPTLGIDEGLAYSINTLLSYLLIAVGILVSLRAVGLDLRLLLVFAGAIGIGVGLGLQNIAANLISGLILIFGRKVRKGDWIQIGDTLGYVESVNLGTTKVKTRDNIEYLMPNSELTASTIVNYTLSEPLIRIHIPVGVSYNAKPDELVAILQAAAENNVNLSKTRAPRVWFTEYGDNSINFELLVWIDVRRISEKEVRSQLYFDIFKALEKAGIEIPFPQRDIHIRSGLK